MASLITRSPAWTGLSPNESSALDAVDATTKTHDVLIDLSTNDIMLDLSADDQIKEKKLRQEVVSHDAKLEAVKQDLSVAEKQYYEASNNWNAALEQPSLTAKELNDLWDERENKLKSVQPLKLLLKKRQEEADMAKVAMRNFENKMIQAKASTSFPSLAFSIDLAADAGESLDFPYDPDCTCATSIIDCRVCYSFAGNKPLPRHQKTSYAKEQTSSADQNVGSTARKSSTVAQQQQPTEVPRYRNKYGDIPNPQTQMKAGRRRRNQDLRKRDPDLYRRIMVEKKAIRDEKLRALRHQQRRRLW